MGKPVYTDAHQGHLLRVIPDLIRSRELLWNLVWSDFRTRYRFAAMGFLWAILEPLALCVVLTFVFSVVFPLRSLDPAIQDRWEFAALLLCALIPWQFFADAVRSGTSSLVDGGDLVGKVYFPRELMPLASIGIAAINFLFSFLVLVVLLTLFGRAPNPAYLWLVIVFGIQFTLVAGLCMFLSCSNVHYRDFKYLVHVGLLFGFYGTPIFYTLDTVRRAVEERAPWLYYAYLINPMCGIINAYRDVLVYHRPPSMYLLIWPAIISILCVVGGEWLFRRRAGYLSDYL